MADQSGAARRPRSDATSTRDRIISVAEDLFARQGVDAVSLIQINREAGQKNRTAVQYHFGSKAGLIDAILDKHRPGVDRARSRILDQLETRPAIALRDVIRALVEPIIDKLDDPDGGPAFVSLQAQLLGHPGFPIIEGTVEPPEGTACVWRLAARLTPRVPKPLVMPKYLMVMSMLFHPVADYAKLEDTNATAIRNTSRETFAENLIDSITAILSISPSNAAREAADRVGMGDSK